MPRLLLHAHAPFLTSHVPVAEFHCAIHTTGIPIDNPNGLTGIYWTFDWFDI